MKKAILMDFCIFLLLNILYFNLANLSQGRLWSIKKYFNKETGNRRNTLCYTLGEKCPYSEFLWFVFSRIRTECGEILPTSPYSIRMRKNIDQKNSKYRRFLRSDTYHQNIALWLLFCVCKIVYLYDLQMSITNPFPCTQLNLNLKIKESSVILKMSTQSILHL